MKESTRELARDIGKSALAPVLAAIGCWVLAVVTGTSDSMLDVWRQDPRSCVVWTLGALSLGIATGWAARGARGRLSDEEGRRRHEDEIRESLTRAENLIDLLNPKEASMLVTMLDGNLEQDIFDSAIVGLQSLGAVSAIAELRSYASGEHIWMFRVSPQWRLYAKWEADLLAERAGVS